ncbi:hypothetical protein H8D51_02525 [bacterium]|nr:hypothetical protein [bacterium]
MTRLTVLFLITICGIVFLGSGCQCKRKSATTITIEGQETVPDYAQEDLPPHPGDWMILGGTRKVGTLNPYLAAHEIEADIASLLFNGLLMYDEQLNLVEDLAQQFQVEKSDGEVTVTITLKSNVIWHPYHDTASGIDVVSWPLSTDDVVYTFDLISSGTFGEPLKQLFSVFDKVEKIDAQTVRISGKETVAGSLYLLTSAILPQKVLSDYKELDSAPFWNKPCGTGPFRFSRWEEDEDRGERTLVLEAFESYFGGKPLLSGVKAREVATDEALFNLVTAGQHDLVYLPARLYLRASSNTQISQRFDFVSAPGLSYSFVGFNLQADAFGANVTSPLADKKIRQALAKAVDRKKLIDGVLFGQASVVNGPLSPSAPGAAQAGGGIEYDSEGARKLLAESGWTDRDGDGFLDKDSNNDGTLDRLNLVLLTNLDNTGQEEIARRITESWQAIGIDAVVRGESWSSLSGTILPSGDFNALLAEWNHGPWPVFESLWHSRAGESGQNYLSYANPEVDASIDALNKESEPSKRHDLIGKTCRLIREDIPAVYLYAPKWLAVVHKRFKGRAGTLSPFGPVQGVARWYVPEKWQFDRD